MTREIENAAGIPVVQIATIVPIAIPHPVGEPELGPEVDKAARRELLMRAFKAMTTKIEEQTIFEKN